VKTPSYRADWFVEVDETIPGEWVIGLARLVSGTPVPALGEAMNWTADGATYQDASAFALDFDAELYFDPKDSNRCWRVGVTWREPDPTQEENPTTFTSPPLEREPEYWIEYNSVSSRVTSAFEVTDVLNGTLSAGLVPMENSAGEPFSPVEKQWLRPVIVIARNVSSPTVALNLNDDHEDTVNASPFTILGKTIAKHHARFERADVGSVRYFNGTPYYRMLIRIELSRTPYYTDRFNEGEYFVNDVTGELERREDDTEYPFQDRTHSSRQKATSLSSHLSSIARFT